MSFPMVALGEVLTKSDEWIDINPNERYKQVTVKLWGKGAILRDEVSGAEIAASKRLVVHSQQFILSRIDARNGNTCKESARNQELERLVGKLYAENEFLKKALGILEKRALEEKEISKVERCS